MEKDLGDYTRTHWYHPDCLPAEEPLGTLAVGKIPGFKDQTAVRKLISELVNSLQPTKPTQPANKSKSRGKKKSPEFTWKGYTLPQFTEFKSLLDTLQTLSTEELKQICRKNDQKITGTKSELIERVADGRVLGRIPKCAECGGGRLRFNAKTGVYTCPGYMEDDQFVRCSKSFQAKEVQRTTWSED